LIPIILGSLGILLTNLAWVSEYKLTLGYISAVTFGVAAITDFVDGYIARSRNIVTEFGSFLDPLADKFLVVSSLIMLLAIDA
jgi:phosphatidylglycerophosphate synthase